VLQGCAKALRRERNDAIWQAWHIEAFHRQKKLPRLKDLLAGDDDKLPRKRMSGQEIEAAMRGVFASRTAGRVTSPSS
jgi:hypothetical protein